MNDFKVGDRVRIIAAEDTDRYKNGDILTICDLSYPGENAHVMVICADGNRELAYVREIEPYTPDLITINRADLPEVVAIGQGFLKASDTTFGNLVTAKDMHERALTYLAVAEFLDARDKATEEAATAEKEAAEKLDMRRNELAELFSGVTGARYVVRNRDLRNAIDRIIELEDDRG